MKTILLSISLAVLVAGCVFTPEGKGLFIPHQTVTPEIQTNAVTQIVQTNWVTNIVFTVNPGVTGKLESAQQIAQNIPTPWGGIAAGVLAGVSGVLGFIAKIKSDKAKLLPAVISGIEAAGDAAAPVKQSVENIAKAAGVQSRLHVEVQRITNG